MRILNSIICLSGIPSIDVILKYDLLEMHEAVFMLTHWPDHIIVYYCEDIAKTMNISRDFFYMPSPPYEYEPDIVEFGKWRFNPNEMGRAFVNIYDAIKKAIIVGSLQARAETLFIGDIYGEKITYFISPGNLIECVCR